MVYFYQVWLITTQNQHPVICLSTYWAHLYLWVGGSLLPFFLKWEKFLYFLLKWTLVNVHIIVKFLWAYSKIVSSHIGSHINAASEMWSVWHFSVTHIQILIRIFAFFLNHDDILGNRDTFNSILNNCRHGKSPISWKILPLLRKMAKNDTSPPLLVNFWKIFQIPKMYKSYKALIFARD